MSSSPQTAAAVVPLLPDGRVLAGERSAQARSLTGYFAFPGGAAEPGDEALPLASRESHERIERAAALRELGEETGRWPLCDEDGGPPSEGTGRTFSQLIDAGAPLAHALNESGLLLDDRELIPLGRWRMRRFDLRQFLLPLTEERLLETRAGPELVDVRWRSLDEVWRGFLAGDVLLIPPIRFVVERLVEGAGRGEALQHVVDALRDVPDASVPWHNEVIRGIAVQPLRSPTLPPATTTNAVLLGAGDFWIVDPATPFDDEQRRFDRVLDGLVASGRRALGIVLTHHHHDHVGDAERLRARLEVPVLAHRETARLVPFAIDRLLDEGDVLDCPGDPPRRFIAYHTPGHAQGHLCLLDEHTRVLVAGDMVAAEGSILIDPDEGHMGTYLRSLERLTALGVRRVVPAHGPLLAYGTEKLQEQIAHRLLRQDQVLAALPDDAPGATPDELVPGIYGGETPRAMYPLAARSVLAALTLLVEQGQAREGAGRYRRR